MLVSYDNYIYLKNFIYEHYEDKVYRDKKLEEFKNKLPLIKDDVPKDKLYIKISFYI